MESPTAPCHTSPRSRQDWVSVIGFKYHTAESSEQRKECRPGKECRLGTAYLSATSLLVPDSWIGPDTSDFRQLAWQDAISGAVAAL